MRLCGCYQVFPLDASDDFTTRHSTHSRDPHHHISGTSVATHVTCHTPMSRVSCSPLTSELGPGPGHRQPLARADRCPADSLTLPRLTPGVTSLARPARAAATYACSGHTPLLHSTAGQACAVCGCSHQMSSNVGHRPIDAAWFRFSGLGCSNILWRTRSDYRYYTKYWYYDYGYLKHKMLA